MAAMHYCAAHSWNQSHHLSTSRFAAGLHKKFLNTSQNDSTTMIQFPTVSQSEVLGQFYNPNTTPKDKESVVVCLCRTGQELH